MKKRLMTTLFGVLSVFASALADDVNYNGTVVSKSGEPIMGATVTVTGTTVSTITDMDGNFSLVIPDGYSTVTVTYSGMKKQTVSVQREPVVLYESSEQAEQAKALAVKKLVNTGRKEFKKNAFNFEIGALNTKGDMDDIYDMYYSLNLGWHHGFNKYITWEVLNASLLLPGDFINDGDGLNSGEILSATTGIRLTSPRWRRISAFASANYGAVFTGFDESFYFKQRYEIGINFGRWCYLAARYDVINLGTYYDCDDDFYYDNYKYIKNLRTLGVVLGFNF